MIMYTKGSEWQWYESSDYKTTLRGGVSDNDNILFHIPPAGKGIFSSHLGRFLSCREKKKRGRERKKRKKGKKKGNKEEN